MPMKPVLVVGRTMFDGHMCVQKSSNQTSDKSNFLFQYPIILPFHTVLGALKARILKWFTILEFLLFHNSALHLPDFETH